MTTSAALIAAPTSPTTLPKNSFSFASLASVAMVPPSGGRWSALADEPTVHPERWTPRWHQRGNLRRFRLMPRSPAKAPEVEIRLLGRFEVLRGNEPQALPASKKSRALLAYLVATARSHLREQLCELLWEAPDDPRASLRWSLAKIRPLVDDADTKRLAADRGEVAFQPNGAKVDVVALRAELPGGPVVASI